MSAGETAKDVSGWTVDTLKAHFDARYDDLRRLLDERAIAAEHAVQAALLATEKAIAKAEAATEKRFESVNEFRAQLADQSNTFMPRTESISRHDRSAEQMMTLAAKIDDEARRCGEARSAMEARIMAQIAQMTSRLDLTQGRANGLGAGWGYLVGAVGLLGAVLAIVLGLR